MDQQYKDALAEVVAGAGEFLVAGASDRERALDRALAIWLELRRPANNDPFAFAGKSSVGLKSVGGIDWKEERRLLLEGERCVAEQQAKLQEEMDQERKASDRPPMTTKVDDPIRVHNEKLMAALAAGFNMDQKAVDAVNDFMRSQIELGRKLKAARDEVLKVQDPGFKRAAALPPVDSGIELDRAVDTDLPVSMLVAAQAEVRSETPWMSEPGVYREAAKRCREFMAQYPSRVYGDTLDRGVPGPDKPARVPDGEVVPCASAGCNPVLVVPNNMAVGKSTADLVERVQARLAARKQAAATCTQEYGTGPGQAGQDPSPETPDHTWTTEPTILR